jgi:hypothetical protein
MSPRVPTEAGESVVGLEILREELSRQIRGGSANWWRVSGWLSRTTMGKIDQRRASDETKLIRREGE